MNRNTFGQSSVFPSSGLNSSSSVAYKQPSHSMRIKMCYDTKWTEKQSPNGNFKYGLFECCSGPNSCENGAVGCRSIFLFFLPFGCTAQAVLNSELASVIGKSSKK
jgi:hypothetical protein